MIPSLAYSSPIPTITRAPRRGPCKHPVRGQNGTAFGRSGTHSPACCAWRAANQNDITLRYPELAGLNDALGARRAVLDGEIVCFDDTGRPSFAALQHRMHISTPARARALAQTSPATYVIFDVLWLDGASLMGQPYAQRRDTLATLGLAGAHWRVPRLRPW